MQTAGVAKGPAGVTMQWFVARTRYGQELKIRELLRRKSIENFIPSGVREVVRCGRRRRTECALIHNLVFMRCSKECALDVANNYGLPINFMIDRNTRTLMVVRDKDMETFMAFFLNDAPVVVDENFTLVPGDRVRVISGPLVGVEGFVIVSEAKTYISITVGTCAQARTEIPKGCLEKI